MFRGGSDLGQLDKIFSVCGTPTLDVWPEVSDLRDYDLVTSSRLNKTYPRRLRSEYSKLPVKALDLLDNMLLLDPKKRISADAALEHEWFKSVTPLPANLPRHCDWHEMSAKKKRQRQRALETSNSQPNLQKPLINA